MSAVTAPRVGVVALQGAVREHVATLASIGAEAVAIRHPSQLADVSALVLPGGESTAMARLAAVDGLFEAVRVRVDAVLPVLGTCAGLILLADEVADPAALAGYATVGGLDVTVRRNAYGAQLASGERSVTLSSGEVMRGVFIRAPRIERVGARVEVLASVDGTPVVVRQGRVIGCAFHPELAGDARLHRLLLAAALDQVA